MKVYQKSIRFNGLNGHNIICPYKSCNKVFYFTICVKCKQVQKIQKYIKEGSIITCTNNDCKTQYIQVNTPIKYSTDIITLEKPKIYTNFPQGVMINHKNEIKYQKINCYYCLRPIVYSTSKTHKNQYYEGQKVECPYDDCKKIFNRIICPFCCNEIYINNGFYEMGSLIKCNICNKVFGKILCPSCKKLNKCENKFKYGTLKCGFANCLKENNIINCLFCKKMNIFDSKISINGKSIKCGYCENYFNEILCPFCRQVNVFPLGDFSFGKLYKCQYLTCMKEFQFLICLKCFTYSYTKDPVEGQKSKCEKCQIKFINLGCPFCRLNICILSSSFKLGQMIKCPNEKCGKKFSFISCSNCHKLIFSQENEDFEGKAVKCPYKGCRKYTISLICPLCKVNIIYAGTKKSFDEGEDIKCQKCKNNFKFKKNNEIYSGEITYLKEIEGKTIDFGIGEIDQNYLGIQELFNGFYKKNKSQLIRNNSNELKSKIKSYIEKYTYNKPLKECIVCHNNIKESIFFPCGHRCVCYNCAVITFTVTKKCPRCNNEASCIIKKIYE